jgi:hypothetical protein
VAAVVSDADTARSEGHSAAGASSASAGDDYPVGERVVALTDTGSAREHWVSTGKWTIGPVVGCPIVAEREDRVAGFVGARGDGRRR